jgi:hypothetical protein
MDEVQKYGIDWILLAFIIAGIAQGKGRSGFNWFILGALFGPITLMALVMFCNNIPKPTNQP